MIEIDGSIGEGGGQILRSSLTLSLMTGEPVRVISIRAGRSKPGLRPQHLKAVEIATQIGRAEIEGCSIGSPTITFAPSGIFPGRYRVDIGTAGSVCLVLQTILVPLSFASGASEVTVTGGTHVPWSPCFHYLDLHWNLFIRRLGFNAELFMKRAGYFPKGAGQLQATIQPIGPGKPFARMDRGPLVEVKGISAVSNLPKSIAERQKDRGYSRMRDWGCPISIDISRFPSSGKGTMLFLKAVFENSQVGYFGLGERGKSAEKVADEAVDQLQSFLRTDGYIDEYLADQLLIPSLVLQESSEYTTSKVTRHLRTNARVIDAFNVGKVELEGEVGQPGRVRILPSTPFRVAT